MTPSDIIRRALKKAGVLGVGQQPAAEDMADALADLNGMLGSWSRRRYLVYHLVDVPVPMTGQSTYRIGPGGDVDMVRPDRIQAAYVRILNGGANPVDVPLDVVGSYEDWSAVAVKGLHGFPRSVFLDSGYPWGTLYLWPVPASTLYRVHLVFKADLVGFKALGDLVDLPPEYDDAILFNLSRRLRMSYGEPPDRALDDEARAALAAIRAANVQVPSLNLAAVPGAGQGGAYNVYSDQGR